MRLLELSGTLAEIDIVKKRPEDEKGVPWTRFQIETMAIINKGATEQGGFYRDMRHYKEVRRALKAMQEDKSATKIFLEDQHYDVLFGNESRPGIIQQFRGWVAGDFTDSYIETWESAKNVSSKEMKKLLKQETPAGADA